MTGRLGRFIAALIAAALLAAGSAGAEVFLNQEKPDDWYERDLLTITMMDYYQNDAFILQCGGETMLIDGGVLEQWQKLIAYLEERGLTHMNIVFNSHPHNDHIECQRVMLKSGRLTADRFVSPFRKNWGNQFQRKLVKMLEEKGIPYIQMKPEEELTLGGATMKLYRWEEGQDPNALSGVLWVHYGDATILLTGDLTGEGQKWMAKHYGSEGLKSDILKSPHHGIVRIVMDFYHAVEPELTVITNWKDCNLKKQLDDEGYPSICTYTGIVTLETDGKDWYVTQDKRESGD